MKVKSEGEVAQSCLTLSDSMDCTLPGSNYFFFNSPGLQHVGGPLTVSLDSVSLLLSCLPLPWSLHFTVPRFLHLSGSPGVLSLSLRLFY